MSFACYKMITISIRRMIDIIFHHCAVKNREDLNARKTSPTCEPLLPAPRAISRDFLRIFFDNSYSSSIFEYHKISYSASIQDHNLPIHKLCRF